MCVCRFELSFNLCNYIKHALNFFIFLTLYKYLILDAPVVAPFIFPPALKEGERAKAFCTVQSGDTPIQFKWKKDGQDIIESSNIETQSVKDSSILFIGSVSAKSSGNYTCLATNAFGSDKFTAALTVTGINFFLKFLIKIMSLVFSKSAYLCIMLFRIKYQNLLKVITY